MNYKYLFIPFLVIFLFFFSYHTIFQQKEFSIVRAGIDSNEARMFTPLVKDDTTLHVFYLYLDHREKSGSSMLIFTPDGYSMLIDAGVEESSFQLSDYLEKIGIEKIDIAVATHPHHDHIGGYLQLMEEGLISEIYMPDLSVGTETYENWMEQIDEHDIPITFLKANESFTLGSFVTFKVYNPLEETLLALNGSAEIPDINNRSVVMRMEYLNHSFLFTGDIYEEQEQKLVSQYSKGLKATVMEAPHHGDDTSSSTKFIQAVSPEYVVMNANILQSLYVLRRYEVLGVSVLPTNMYGTVYFQTDGETLSVMTQFNNPPEKKKRHIR